MPHISLTVCWMLRLNAKLAKISDIEALSKQESFNFKRTFSESVLWNGLFLKNVQEKNSTDAKVQWCCIGWAREFLFDSFQIKCTVSVVGQCHCISFDESGDIVIIESYTERTRLGIVSIGAFVTLVDCGGIGLVDRHDTLWDVFYFHLGRIARVRIYCFPNRANQVIDSLGFVLVIVTAWSEADTRKHRKERKREKLDFFILRLLLNY